MNERQSRVFNKNNKNGNMILKNFLVGFEYIISCLENCYLSLSNTPLKAKAPYPLL